MSVRVNSNNTGLPTVLFMIFLVLKLVGVINWSWWWVTAPLWIMASFTGAFFVLFFVVALVVTLAKIIVTR